MINRISNPILRKEEFTKGYFSKVNYFEGHYLKQKGCLKA